MYPGTRRVYLSPHARGDDLWQGGSVRDPVGLKRSLHRREPLRSRWSPPPTLGTGISKVVQGGYVDATDWAD